MVNDFSSLKFIQNRIFNKKLILLKTVCFLFMVSVEQQARSIRMHTLEVSNLVMCNAIKTFNVQVLLDVTTLSLDH